MCLGETDEGLRLGVRAPCAACSASTPPLAGVPGEVQCGARGFQRGRPVCRSCAVAAAGCGWSEARRARSDTVDGVGTDLDRGREAFGRREWGPAYAGLRAADAVLPLDLD